MPLVTINLHIHGASDEQLGAINLRLDKIMATSNEAVTRLQALGEKVDKIGSETRGLLIRLDELLDQLANQGGLNQGVLDAIAAVEAKAAVVDELVPDAPTPEPAP